MLGIGDSLQGRLLLLDALGTTIDEVSVQRDPGCPVCGEHPTITEYVDYVRVLLRGARVTKVRIPPTLRNEVGGERELVGAGETVREVLEDLSGRYPALEAQLFEDGGLAPFVNVYVGGEDVRTLDGLETRVNGASVILLPAMAGGC